MKRLAFSLLSIALFSAVAIKVSAQDSSTQTRQVSGFSSIASGGPFNVHIKMDGTESVKVEADANIINDIETVVEGSTLQIRFKDRHWNNHYNNIHKAEVYISAKELNGLINSGSGHMEVEGTINTSGEFKAVLSGSGSINTSVKSGDLHAVISGSGSIRINGSTGNADMMISGSGQIEGKGLKTESTKAVITGSGNIYVTAEKSVSAHITGSGSVMYSGSASVIDTRTIGSGRVTRAD
ncbi:MAG TPA: head GIN domain-containing protein [Mucilaginibacter sp.]|nr:head GIN domain-containing protein [Mucilaginibacter sp.]